MRVARASTSTTTTIRALLAERTTDLTEGWPEPDTDVVLLGADSTERARRRSATLATRIRPNGAIWVVSRKGKAATLRDVEVIAAARAARLVDNKVASFSATHTALAPRRSRSRAAEPPARRRTPWRSARCTIRAWAPTCCSS